MKVTTFEPMLREATIKAIDGIAKKAGATEKEIEGAVGKLLKRWNALDASEKEHVAGMVIATATTAVAAISALRSKFKERKDEGGVTKAAKKAAKSAKKLLA
jgi:hypothetical protein